MVVDGPVFMDHRKETIHFIRNVSKVRRKVIPYVNWFFAIASAKLGNVGHSRIIQRPQRIFVKSFDPFFKRNFYAVGQ